MTVTSTLTGCFAKVTLIFSLENRWALAIAALLVLLTILTASAAPLWIYQGF
jgi:hypothetical protein